MNEDKNKEFKSAETLFIISTLVSIIGTGIVVFGATLHWGLWFGAIVGGVVILIVGFIGCFMAAIGISEYKKEKLDG